MDITALKNQIMKNELEHLYIFTGTEIGIQQIYLQQMSNKLSLPIVRADSVAQIYDECTETTMFGSSANLYVIRGDTDIMKAEKVYPTLEKDIKNNVIVLEYDKIDARLKFGHFFKDKIVAFDKLALSVLKSYIKKASNLSDSSAEELSNKVSLSYDMAMLEADKINRYANAKGISADDSMNHLIQTGVIYQPQEYNVFQLTDAVCRRDVNESIRIAGILKANNTPSVNVLGTLYNSLKTVLLIQCCEGSDVANITGLDSRQIYFNKKYINKYYSTSELVSAIKLLGKVVDDIKTGKIDDDIAVEFSLLHII
jgi:DNA polymerase III delta subunit